MPRRPGSDLETNLAEQKNGAILENGVSIGIIIDRADKKRDAAELDDANRGLIKRSASAQGIANATVLVAASAKALPNGRSVVVVYYIGGVARLERVWLVLDDRMYKVDALLWNSIDAAQVGAAEHIVSTLRPLD